MPCRLTGFVLCVKLDSALSIKVQISLNGSSRTGKTKHWQRYRNWYIDANAR